MRTYGVNGFKSYIRNHISLGCLFSSLVASKPDLFRIVAPPAFALVVISIVPRVPVLLWKVMTKKAGELKLSEAHNVCSSCYPKVQPAALWRYPAGQDDKTSTVALSNGQAHADGNSLANGHPHTNGEFLTNGHAHTNEETLTDGHTPANGEVLKDTEAKQEKERRPRIRSQTDVNAAQKREAHINAVNGINGVSGAHTPNVSNGVNGANGTNGINGVNSVNGVHKTNGLLDANESVTNGKEPQIKTPPPTTSSGVPPVSNNKSLSPKANTIDSPRSCAEDWLTEYTNVLAKAVYERVNRQGEIMLTSTVIGGLFVIRVNTANPKIEERHVRRAFEILVEAAEEVVMDG